MLLQIKYFGMLTEITNRSDESLEFSGSTVNDLLTQLTATYPLLGNKDFKVAVDQVIVSNDHKITHPEIALLPPFSGG